MKLKVKLMEQIYGLSAGEIVEVRKYVPKFYNSYIDPRAWEILPEYTKLQEGAYYTYEPSFVIGQNDFEILDAPYYKTHDG